MSQVVASEAYCLENSLHLTRPGFDAFLRSDANHSPTIVDPRQVKRLYRLQRKPNVNTSLTLDQSEVGYEESGYFDEVLRRQIKESTSEPTRSVYHRPTDMSDASMARFSFGKSRPDPHRLIPNESTTVRKHPAALSYLRHDQGPNGEIVSRFTDRAVPDRAVRARIALGRSFNARTNRDNYRTPETVDDMARRYMYTSAQQAASDEVAWDSKMPAKVPVPTTTFEDETNSMFKSQSLPSFYDARSYDVLEWDRVQPRHSRSPRKPLNNIAPLPRAHQISGYSGVIGGERIQEIDDPTMDFKPSTMVRSEQPKIFSNSIKSNLPGYTGKTHWTKVDPVSHYDQSGRAYTTTGAFHRSLPIDNISPRYNGPHGSFSRLVTTVFPQNPFNQLDHGSTTINSSLDGHPSVVIRSLPAKSFPSPRRPVEEETEPIVTN